MASNSADCYVDRKGVEWVEESDDENNECDKCCEDIDDDDNECMSCEKCTAKYCPDCYDESLFWCAKCETYYCYECSVECIVGKLTYCDDCNDEMINEEQEEEETEVMKAIKKYNEEMKELDELENLEIQCRICGNPGKYEDIRDDYEGEKDYEYGTCADCEEEEVRCVCDLCYGEGKCYVSKERARELEELELMESKCPYGDKCVERTTEIREIMKAEWGEEIKEITQNK